MPGLGGVGSHKMSNFCSRPQLSWCLLSLVLWFRWLHSFIDIWTFNLRIKRWNASKFVVGFSSSNKMFRNFHLKIIALIHCYIIFKVFQSILFLVDVYFVLIMVLMTTDCCDIRGAFKYLITCYIFTLFKIVIIQPVSVLCYKNVAKQKQKLQFVQCINIFILYEHWLSFKRKENHNISSETLKCLRYKGFRNCALAIFKVPRFAFIFFSLPAFCCIFLLVFCGIEKII